MVRALVPSPTGLSIVLASRVTFLRRTNACLHIHPLRDPHFSCPGLLDFITSNEPIRGWAKAITIAGPSGNHSQSQGGVQPHFSPPTASLPHNERGEIQELMRTGKLTMGLLGSLLPGRPSAGSGPRTCSRSRGGEKQSGC